MARSYFIPNERQGNFQQGARDLATGIGFRKERQDRVRERREDERKKVAEEYIGKYGMPGAVRARPDLIWDYAQDFGIDVGPFYDEQGNVRADIFVEQDGVVNTPGIPWNPDQQARFNIDLADAFATSEEQASRQEATPVRGGDSSTQTTPEKPATGEKPPTAEPTTEPQPEPTPTPTPEENVTRPRAGGQNYGPGRVFENETDKTFMNEAFRIISSNQPGSGVGGGGSATDAELQNQLTKLRENYVEATGVEPPNWVIGRLIALRNDPQGLQEFKREHLSGVQFNSLDSLMENVDDLSIGRGQDRVTPGSQSGDTSFGPNAQFGATRSFGEPEPQVEIPQREQQDRYEGLNNPEFWREQEQRREQERAVPGIQLNRPAPEEPTGSDPNQSDPNQTETPVQGGRIMQGGTPVYESALSFLNENPFAPGERVGGEFTEQMEDQKESLQSREEKVIRSVAMGDAESMEAFLTTASPTERETLSAEIDRELNTTYAKSAPETVASMQQLGEGIEKMIQDRNRVSPQAEVQVRRGYQQLRGKVRAAKARAVGEIRREGIQNLEAVQEAYSTENANKFVENMLSLRETDPERYNLFFTRTAAQQALLEEKQGQAAVSRAEGARANSMLRAIGLNPQTLKPLPGKENAEKYANFLDEFNNQIIEQMKAAGLENELTSARIQNLKKNTALIGARLEMIENMKGGEGDPTAIFKMIQQLSLENWGDMDASQKEFITGFMGFLGNMVGMPIGMEPAPFKLFDPSTWRGNKMVPTFGGGGQNTPTATPTMSGDASNFMDNFE